MSIPKIGSCVNIQYWLDKLIYTWCLSVEPAAFTKICRKTIVRFATHGQFSGFFWEFQGNSPCNEISFPCYTLNALSCRLVRPMKLLVFPHVNYDGTSISTVWARLRPEAMSSVVGVTLFLCSCVIGTYQPSLTCTVSTIWALCLLLKWWIGYCGS